MRRQAGNIFFFLFGAVAVAGVLGVTIQNYVMGPLKTATMVNKRNAADTELQLSLRMMAVAAAGNQANNGDCDSDGAVEPLPYTDAGVNPHPVGGGVLPTTIGGSKRDPWGSDYGYCVWDHGTLIDDAACGGPAQLRLPGTSSDQWDVIAIISAGPDKLFQTDCNAWADVNADSQPDTPLVNKPAGSDDMYYAWTYAEAANGSGSLWTLEQLDPDTAEINKNLSVKDGSNVEQLAFDATAKTLTLGTGGAGQFPTVRADYIGLMTATNPSIELLNAIGFAPEDGDDASFYISNPTGEYLRLSSSLSPAPSTGGFFIMPSAIEQTAMLVGDLNIVRNIPNTATFTEAFGQKTVINTQGAGGTVLGETIQVSAENAVQAVASVMTVSGSDLSSVVGASIGTISNNNSAPTNITGISNGINATGSGSDATGAVYGVQNTLQISHPLSGATGIVNGLNIQRSVDTISGINSSSNINATSNVTSIHGLYIFQSKTAGAGVATNRYGIYINQTGPATNDWGIYQAGGQRNYLSGNLGINQTNPTVALSVTGDINYTGTLTDTSDRRLKDNIRPLEGSLDKLMMLDGFAFEMKNDPKKQTEYGVMAQDVEKAFPELVHTIDKDGHLGVTYDGLIPPIIEAIKELKAENEKLRAEIEALKKTQSSKE